ncbi:MAG: HAMP domain-containing protein, partial [Calditrichaeota bacterium]
MKRYAEKIYSMFTGSIKAKLGTVYSLLVALIAVFIFSYFPAQQEAQAIHAMIDKARSISQITAINISSALYFEDIPTIQEAFQSVRQNRDLVYAIVCDTTGEIVAAYNLPRATSFRNSQLNHLSLQNNLYQTVTPILINDEEIGKLYMGFSLLELKAQVNKSRRVIAMMTLLLFVTGIMIVVGISMFLSRPLTRMMETVNRISIGDLSQRALVTSRDEIGTLAKMFNQMVDHLESSQTELKKVNQQLGNYTKELQLEIEERKRIEKKLRLSDEILSNVGNIVLVSNPAGEIVYASPSIQRLLGYSVEEVLGDGWLNLTRRNQLDREEEKQYLASAAKGEIQPAAEPYERMIYDKYGNKHWILWQDTRGPNNMLIGIGSIVDDWKKAELRQLELLKELENVNRELKDFAYVVSHDLKAPLRAIGSLANWLKTDYADRLDEEGLELINLLDSR